MDYTIEGEHANQLPKKSCRKLTAIQLRITNWSRDSQPLKRMASTACGCWIYSGVFPKMGENRANQRAAKGFYGHGWGSLGLPTGEFFTIALPPVPTAIPGATEEARLVGFRKQEMDGPRRSDFTATKPPDYRRLRRRKACGTGR